MQKTDTKAVLAIFSIATAVVLIGGLISIVTISVQEAQAQSGTNSKVCEQTDPYNVHRFNEGCIGTKTNPSNPNSACGSGQEFGANKTGKANC